MCIRDRSYEVVPGVTSAIAAPAYAGIPVTHRDAASSFTVITGHERDGKGVSAIPWGQVARLKGTLVFLMGMEKDVYKRQPSRTRSPNGPRRTAARSTASAPSTP